MFLCLFLFCCGGFENDRFSDVFEYAESFLKAAIALIPSVPATQCQHALTYLTHKSTPTHAHTRHTHTTIHTTEIQAKRVSTEEDLVSFLRSFASFLLVFPGVFSVC